MDILLRFILLLVGTVLPLALPPLRWGLRLWGCCALLAFLGTMVAPKVIEGGLSVSMAIAALLLLCGVWLLALALRGGFEKFRYGQIVPAGRDRHFLVWFDRALLVVLGAGPGALVFYWLAVAFQGSAGGLRLHVVVAGVAIGLAISVWLWWRAFWSIPFISACAVVAVLALDGGLRYPDLILEDAVKLGERYCLTIGNAMVAPHSKADLMALTLPKNDNGPPDLMLLAQSKRGIAAYRWSFRARQFVGVSEIYESDMNCVLGGPQFTQE